MCVTSYAMGQNIEKSVLDKMLSNYYSNGNEPGIVVAISQHGQIRYHYAVGIADQKTKQKITEKTHFRMASVSKQVTAQAICSLFAQGKLKPTDQLGLFFDNLPLALKGVTVAQLLQHRSGIMDYEALIPSDRTAQVSDRDVLDYIRQTDTVYFPSGSQFRYSNTGYCLLALIVEQVAKESFAGFVKKHLFLPNGIRDGIVYSMDSDILNRAFGYHPKEDTFVFADQSVTSATQGDGGVYLSALEYHQWANFLLHKRFSEALVQGFLGKESIPVKDGVSYNLGWFIYPLEGNRLFFHSGESTGFHNIVYLDQQKDLIITLFSNRDDLLIGDAFDALLAILKLPKPMGPSAQNKSVFGWLNAIYAN
ncbi:serine hydrolase domain-containing protein [Sphingobacterium prati]|uniref:serine hydrolase domain-containing protein n=1 Tax=Sphingobacterium prati TaxID=2737006 RepID=UPI001555FBA6|nr:serine hydrolase domain-containing protein [Sphingobacterium prati]NPE45617.1 beta-lactamase family protein [Sphingobacterium prati]